MILNVSGRTDIVAFYMEWFMNRYREGYVDVRNPFYPKMVSRISFSHVDAIVFCTKNPIPLLSYLDEIKKPILLHVTLTPYHQDVEPNVPKKKDIVESIKILSEKLGKERVYVRYDPILLNERYTIFYHVVSFERLCSILQGKIKHIIISFLDSYKNVKAHEASLKLKEILPQDMETLAKAFGRIAKKYDMTVQTCGEEKRFLQYGLINRDCVDEILAHELTGKVKFKSWKARGHNCHCVELVDIGVYNTCSHFCQYCYANYDEKLVLKQKKMHDVNSSLLIGHLNKDDIIKERQG